MNTKFGFRLFVFIVLTSLVFISFSAVAQTGEPPDFPRSNQPKYSPKEYAPILPLDVSRPTPPNVTTTRVPIMNQVLAVLGDPGFNFRYADEFGSVEEGYLEDHTHLNYPYGIDAVGNSVWIADEFGARVQEFNSVGVFQKQFGKSGFRYGIDGASLECLQDVALDAGGNVWIVDGCAHHVTKLNASGEYQSELGDRWNGGTGNNQFYKPRGVAFDSSGNIYVSDRGNHRIQVFDPTGVYTATIGVTGVSSTSNDHFNTQQHINIDNSDLLYVADLYNHRVQIFDVSNVASITYVATIGVSGVPGSDNNHFNIPVGVEIDNSKIYVADCVNNRVQIFNRTTRNYLSTLGGGSGNYQLNCPTDVAVDTSGNIYVALYDNLRVQQYNQSLVYQRTYGTAYIPYLTDGGHFFRPSGVALAQDNSMYIVEEYGSRLIKLNAAGTPIWTIGEAGVRGEDNNHFREAQDVALDGSGKVYVADTWNNRIQIFNNDGSYNTTFGSYGDGDYQFDGAHGIAFDTSGFLYVADYNNHRVQIYNSNLVYQGTLGVTGFSGSDNSHFISPRDVAVDSAGNIYVLDQGNHRVQVFDNTRSYIRTIGESGMSGWDYGHFNFPTAVAVDQNGFTYVADGWGSRIQIHDETGAYLTTIGNQGGKRTGEIRQVEGLAFDKHGNLYAAELLNHRIQKFAMGVPNWAQTNINGFGEPGQGVKTLNVFNNQLYAGTSEDATVWRSSDGKSWSEITPGWAYDPDRAVSSAVVFNSQLYIGTSWWENCEIRRFNGTSWEQVDSGCFGDANSYGIFHLGVFDNKIYAIASNWETGTEVWRSSNGNSGTWSQVNTDGFNGSNHTWQDHSMDVFNGYLYVGLARDDGGESSIAELWRSSDGSTWNPVFTDGLALNNTHVASMAEFNGYFYIGLRNVTSGGEVWRSNDGVTFNKVFDSGLGDPNNLRPYGLLVYDDQLYLSITNEETGDEIWRTSDGSTWEQVNIDGWGFSYNNYSDYFDKGAAVFKNSLYFGTLNGAIGGEIWEYLPETIYLPLVIR